MLPMKLGDGNNHQVVCMYLAQTLSVSIDGTVVLKVPLVIEATLRLSNNRFASIGFTSGLGAGCDNNLLLSWTFHNI